MVERCRVRVDTTTLTSQFFLAALRNWFFKGESQPGEWCHAGRVLGSIWGSVGWGASCEGRYWNAAALQCMPARGSRDHISYLSPKDPAAAVIFEMTRQYHVATNQRMNDSISSAQQKCKNLRSFGSKPRIRLR
jgi:hypothetical protein